MECLEKKLASCGLVKLNPFLLSITPTWDLLSIPQHSKLNVSQNCTGQNCSAELHLLWDRKGVSFLQWDREGEKSTHGWDILSAQSADRLWVSFLFVKDEVWGRWQRQAPRRWWHEVHTQSWRSPKAELFALFHFLTNLPSSKRTTCSDQPGHLRVFYWLEGRFLCGS